MSYDPDEPRYTFGALTMLDDGWPNGAYRYPAPEADEPCAAAASAVRGGRTEAAQRRREGGKMKYLWCITKDWENPADGERWHKAKSEETAATAGVRYIRKNTHHYAGSYLRFVSKRDGSTVVDFGNHVWFILIKKES